MLFSGHEEALLWPVLRTLNFDDFIWFVPVGGSILIPSNQSEEHRGGHEDTEN